MSSRYHRPPQHQYELVPRSSLDAEGLPDLDRSTSNTSSWLGRLAGSVKQLSKPAAYAHLVTPRRTKRSLLRFVYWSLFSIPYICLLLVLIWGVFLPSYTHRPAHYNELRRLALQSSSPGRANIRNEKVFIAASIYEVNGTLSSGAWGRSVLDLIDLLGPRNVYLSIYENNADPLTKASLERFRQKTPCNSSIISEDIDMNTIPHVTLPSGERLVKRIAFLAEVRNRALTPIDFADMPFDRLLFINDVNFNPIDAAQLLFSTNADATGRANYGAACAVDFINPFKFYDRFATRDLEGYNMGIPFYPWFTSAGSATSRSDVLHNSDAVRVRSCWGGMTAFEAKWFQDTDKFNNEPLKNSTPQSAHEAVKPLRFRYEQETFWESSECCLIHADLQYLCTGLGMPPESGIYMNPFIRVAYDPKTLSWLPLTRRPERLYAVIHDILNHAVGLPNTNTRQTEEPGRLFTDRVWEYNDPVAAFASNATHADKNGHWKEIQRVAKPGGFCGGPNLLFLNDDEREGKSKWGGMKAPSPPR
ncbi:hypothetical protein CC78DRAFT_452195 [Lojkania enalia]|uniref:Glycosyltransferase family 69 protein n=1 Tax=Lojkania enalia TaxID=147567 RepID=A0A9P4TQ08_9PLEO|nr:hypothetical protein CC78DRAFT_452195 [Didymosphaeria enalia]